MQHAMKYLQQNQPALAEHIQEFLATEKHRDSAPVLTAIGLYNAGKSTLLNVLTEHLEVEMFKTARVRETRNLKKMCHDKVVYQDTPGLDADLHDDKTALKAIANSDLLLLCHSVSLGELDLPTLDYLQQIQQQSGLPLSDRLICVLTKAEDESKVESAQALVKQQLKQLMGESPDVFCVSSNNYKRGVIEHKPVLRRSSGIPPLKIHLQKVLDQQRQQLLHSRLQQRQLQANQLMAQVEQQLQQQQQNYQAQLARADHKFAQLGQVLTRSVSDLQAL